jgi:phosphatidate cytidylyltransferase
MLKRTLTAIPALMLLVAAIYLHGYFLIVPLGILSLIAEYEMIAAAKSGGVSLFEPLLYVATALLVPAYLFFQFTGIMLLFMAFAVAVSVATVVQKELSLKKMAYTLALYVYPQAFFAFLIAIAAIKDANLSRLLVTFLFATAILTDACAYFVGIAFGKRKLCPVISPHKTVAGAVGGLAGGIAAAAFSGLCIQSLLNIHIGLLHYFILGIIMSILSMIGDLTASLVKREFGIKDYGGIMPGHGGIMDRLDSVIFIAPVLFFYVLFIVQISV